jgi:hypothetical protein
MDSFGILAPKSQHRRRQFLPLHQMRAHFLPLDLLQADVLTPLQAKARVTSMAAG